MNSDNKYTYDNTFARRKATKEPADEPEKNLNNDIQVKNTSCTSIKWLKKVTSHHAFKQAELIRITTEWIVTDSLPFSVVHGKGYRKMMNRFDPAFIPLNLWTARSKDGYIGVILHWLTLNFEIRDVILAVEHMEYPHTDNGAKMKKAIRIWDSVECLSYSAHTLQLTIIQALKVIKPHTKRIRKLVKFFQSLKQCQRLDQAQIDLSQRSKTNTNPIQLYDSKNLPEIYLRNLFEEIVRVLKPFNELTTYFSVIQYTTHLVVNPSIETLKLEFANGAILKLNEIGEIINDDRLNDNEISSDDDCDKISEDDTPQ
ncbi:6033_t:CDS:2 [Ambispora gerdemannii]|uniref:6033_t:CDS:1 n=1 Tax=Ambispora gerdemannii TaxID=144530 RepID=A0A9N8YN98_9GLOM|nr:6033_t:CDS:2 [Ambispora gerdemannii]